MQVIRCYNCMAEIETDICPYCGFENAKYQAPSYALQPGSILHGKYLVGRVLGQGGFGITYVGFDLSLELKIAIKEYFSPRWSFRNSAQGSEVHWSTQNGDAMSEQDIFLREARKMTKLRALPGVVHVMEIFQDNVTAYIIMDFADGETLAARMQRLRRPLTWNEMAPILFDVLNTMEQVHRRGMIHRDLSPDNLMLSPDGRVLILDLGAAKDLGRSDGASSMIVAKNGFTPLEQYAQRGSAAPAGDIYSLAATIYYALTGQAPPSAIDRIEYDSLDLSSLAESDVPANAIGALRAVLAIRRDDRIQTMSDFRTLLTGRTQENTPVRPVSPGGSVPKYVNPSGSAVSDESLNKSRKKKCLRWIIPVVSGAACLVLMISLLTTRYLEVVLHYTAQDHTAEEDDSAWKEMIAGQFTYEDNSDGSITITGYEEQFGNFDDGAYLDIPSEIDGKPVTALGDFAFYKLEQVEFVKVPDGVVSIGARAFARSSSLKGVELPEGLASIGEWAFFYCTSLESIGMKEGLTSISERAFWNCNFSEVYAGRDCNFDHVFEPGVTIHYYD